jgi:hypothetical protein
MLLSPATFRGHRQSMAIFPEAEANSKTETGHLCDIV